MNPDEEMRRRKRMESDEKSFCRGERGIVSYCVHYSLDRCFPHILTCRYAQDKFNSDNCLKELIDRAEK